MVTITISEGIEQIVKKYAEQIKKKYKLYEIYIYGSYAKGTFKTDSDIDIAVVADGFSGDLIEDTFNLMKIRRTIDYRIESHPFNRSEFTMDNPYAKEIITTGIKIQ